MIKPNNRPGGRRKTCKPRLWRVGNAPLSPPTAVLPPKGETTHYILCVAGAPTKCVRCAPRRGEVLAALCLEMFMSSEAERRANLPLRERCRRQKGCISDGPQARFYGFRCQRQHIYSSPSGDTTPFEPACWKRAEPSEPCREAAPMAIPSPLNPLNPLHTMNTISPKFPSKKYLTE